MGSAWIYPGCIRGLPSGNLTWQWKKTPVYVNCYLLCFRLSWHLSASHFELQVPILLLSLVLVDTIITC